MQYSQIVLEVRAKLTMNYKRQNLEAAKRSHLDISQDWWATLTTLALSILIFLKILPQIPW